MSIALSLLALIPFYLLGAFPTGLLLAKAKGIDITSVGSGNVGATNVARTLGKRAGLFTLLGDISKGLIGTAAAGSIGSDNFMYTAAAALVAGHCISLPPRLKGGKGVATALGVLLYLNYTAAMTGVAVFVITFTLSRIVSASSLAAAITIPIAAALSQTNNNQLFAMGFISLIILVRHRENLTRLVEGREKRFEFGSKS